MKLNFSHSEASSSGSGYAGTISLRIETQDQDQYRRIVTAIEGAIPEPKAVEEKPRALGFHQAEEPAEAAEDEG